MKPTGCWLQSAKIINLYFISFRNYLFFQLNNESGVYLHVSTLIELIDSKLCLWDKTGDSYKDKIEKSKAWREICAFLARDFHQMDGKKQFEISKYAFINTF